VGCVIQEVDLSRELRRSLLRSGGQQEAPLTIGQDIDFRMEKEKAYLKGEKKETKYRIVGMGKPDQKQNPD